MAKMGRPKSDNPKDFKVSVRLTEDEYNQLKERAANDDLTIAQTIRKCIMKMLKSKQ